MITGSSGWTTKLNAEQKRPFYIFFIPGKQMAMCSFMPFLSGGGLDTSLITLGNWADLATSGAGSPIVTTAAGRFQPWMVGFSLVVSTGTNFSAGTYLIEKWNSLTSVTLQTSPTPGGAGASGVSTINVTLLPILQIPTGASQQIDELNSHSSISSMDISAIDPSGALKSLAADTAAIGQLSMVTMGFAGLDISEFIAIHTGRISQIGRSSEGLMTIHVNDMLSSLVNDVFLNGGPFEFQQFSAPALLSLTSQSGDVRQVIIAGWDGSGTGLLETVTLTGATEVLSSNTYRYLLSVAAVAPVAPPQPPMGSMLYTVVMREGSGGTIIGTIEPGATNGTGTSSIVASPPAVPNALLDNGSPISNDNPRYLSGHPLDILLVVMQNELGVGQNSGPALVINTGGGSGTGQAGFGINPSWTFYDGTSGLINPNPYLDVPNVLALRDGQFAGMRMEFTLSSPETGKNWLEDQILKPLGLYWITGADGKLRLKTMKHPVSPTTVAISDHQIRGIPDLSVWPIVNMIQVNVPIGDTADNSESGLCFVQQDSISKFQNRYLFNFTADGLRFSLGATTAIFLLSNRIFNRHAFGTPEYSFTTFLKNFVLELGDFILLTHPKLLDMVTGTVGVSGVLCEITERQPDYANGVVTFKCVDTRFMGVSNGAFEIAAVGDAIPVYGSATSPERAQYMFIALNTGLYSTGAAGNEVQ